MFFKVISGDTLSRDKPRPERSLDFDQDALSELVECNPHKQYSSISNSFQHITIHNLPSLEKDRKSEKTGRLASSYS